MLPPILMKCDSKLLYNFQTAVQGWLQGLPDVTKATCALCATVHLASLPWDTPPATCFSVQAALQHFQLYRALTAPFVHTGFLHLLLNLLSWLLLAPRLEAAYGSLRFACALRPCYKHDASDFACFKGSTDIFGRT